jgi:hypothetical protein
MLAIILLRIVLYEFTVKALGLGDVKMPASGFKPGSRLASSDAWSLHRYRRSNRVCS